MFLWVTILRWASWNLETARCVIVGPQTLPSKAVLWLFLIECFREFTRKSSLSLVFKNEVSSGWIPDMFSFRMLLRFLFSRCKITFLVWLWARTLRDRNRLHFAVYHKIKTSSLLKNSCKILRLKYYFHKCTGYFHRVG